MNKILLAIFVCAFTVSAFACGGSKQKTDSEKPKDAEQTQRSL